MIGAGHIVALLLVLLVLDDMIMKWKPTLLAKVFRRERAVERWRNHGNS